MQPDLFGQTWYSWLKLLPLSWDLLAYAVLSKVLLHQQQFICPSVVKVTGGLFVWFMQLWNTVLWGRIKKNFSTPRSQLWSRFSMYEGQRMKKRIMVRWVIYAASFLPYWFHITNDCKMWSDNVMFTLGSGETCLVAQCRRLNPNTRQVVSGKG